MYLRVCVCARVCMCVDVYVCTYVRLIRFLEVDFNRWQIPPIPFPLIDNNR